MASFLLIYSRRLTILGSYYCKKQIGVSLLRVCPLIDDKFRHYIVNVYGGTTQSPAARGSTATLTMLWRNLPSIRGQTNKKTDVNLLTNHPVELLKEHKYSPPKVPGEVA